MRSSISAGSASSGAMTVTAPSGSTEIERDERGLWVRVYSMTALRVREIRDQMVRRDTT
jgi:hypothetical protein